MDRLENLRQEVNNILNQQSDPEERRVGYIHLYGVSATCVLLAKARGLDPQLSAAAGMLHDIATYRTGDPSGHAKRGSVEAEEILNRVGGFSQDEIKDVCSAILTHSAKPKVHGPLAELLKDADVLEHYLYNPQFEVIWKERLDRILDELGLNEV
jgi:uncharacterized protein